VILIDDRLIGFPGQLVHVTTASAKEVSVHACQPVHRSRDRRKASSWRLRTEVNKVRWENV